MSEKIKQLTSDLNAILNAHTYRVEVDTEDIVFGFTKTIKKRTKSLAKFISLKVKTANDLGRYLSDSVRIVAVRWYTDGELTNLNNS